MKFRSAPENLSKDAVKSMLKQHNFFCVSSWLGGTSKYANPDSIGFCNKYEAQKEGLVIYDHTSGLMWQQSGSDNYITYRRISEYIDLLNLEQFAGYSDWRLPTLEEAMSLMKPTKNKEGLYIDTLFDKQQVQIWTSDNYSPSKSYVDSFKRRLFARKNLRPWDTWVVSFYLGYCHEDAYVSYVRAVR